MTRVPFLLQLILLLSLISSCAPTVIQPLPQQVKPQLQSNLFISFDGTRLPLRSWKAEDSPDAVIIALHGFNDYSHFIDSAASYFSQHHISLYAYDQRGFGGSENRGLWAGKELLTADLQVLIQLIRTRHSEKPLFLLGESMGAAVVLSAMTEADIRVDGVILAAPAIWGWSSMPLWQQWGLWIGAHTMPASHFTGQSLNIVASDNRKMLIALGADPLVIKETRVDTIYGLVNLMEAGFQAVNSLKSPALILYGEKDQVIPRAPVLEMFGPLVQSNTSQRLQLYKNGYHMLLRDLQAEVVWSDIISWVHDRNTVLPSEGLALSVKHQQ